MVVYDVTSKWCNQTKHACILNKLLAKLSVHDLAFYIIRCSIDVIDYQRGKHLYDLSLTSTYVYLTKPVMCVKTCQ